MSWLDAFYPGNIQDIPAQLPPGPPKPGETGYDEYQRLEARLPLALTSLLPGAVAQVMPLGKTPEGDIEPTVPGVVSSIYGGVGSGVPWAINKVAGALGYQTNLPSAPGTEEMQRQYEDTSRLAKDLIPTNKLAENETEQRMHDYAFSAGGMYVPGLSSVLAGLPSVIAKPVSWVAPTAEHFLPNAQVQAFASGATSAYQKDHPDVTTVPGLGDALSSAVQPDTTTPTQGATTQPHPATLDQPATPATVPSDVGTQPPTSIGSALDRILSGQAPQQPAPTFSQLGESAGTVGEVAAAGGAAILGIIAGKRMLGIGQEMTANARAARLADPAYAQKAADFQAAQVAAQGSQISDPVLGNKVQAPLPTDGAVHTAATAAKTNVLDANAQMEDLIKMTAQSPQAGDKLRSEYGMIMNDAAWQNKLRAFLSTGVDYATKLVMPAPKRLFDDIGRATEAQQKALNDVLYAKDAMDDRLYMQQQGITPARRSFPNQSDQDLARIIVDGQRDPLVANLATRFNTVTQRMVDMGEARGYFTPTEASFLRTTHPNYVPTVDATGNIMNVLEARNYAPNAGLNQVNSLAWQSLSQYVERISHQFELNTLRSNMLDHFETFNANNPGAAPLVERVRTGGPQQTFGGVNVSAATPGMERTITVRRPTGVQYYKVNNHDLYDVLTGENANKMRTMFDAATTARRLVSSGTTGLMSTLSLRAFPITNLMRTAFQLPINRPKGYVGGLMDYGAQKLSGGRFGYRLPDPTNIPGAAYSIGRGAFDDVAHKLANLFDKENTGVSSQIVKSIITPQRMDLINKALKDYYLGTTTYQKLAEGVGASSVPYRLRTPAYGSGDHFVRSMSGQLSPSLFLNGGKLGTIKPATIRLMDAANKIFTSISDGSHDYFYRLNNFAGGHEPASLAYETRAIVGDPGVHGAGKAVTGLRSYVPYANVSAQGVTRFGRALKDTPVGTSAGLVGGLGSLALLSIYTAMQHPETLNYLQNQVPSQGSAANAYLFNGPNPATAAMFSLPQELRPFYPMMMDIISKAINLDAAQHDAGVHDSITSFLKDWFAEHIENQTWQSTMHGVSDAAAIVDVPSVANAVIAPITGKSIRIDPARLYGDWSTGSGPLGNLSFSSFAMPTGTDAPLPNQSPGDNFLDAMDGKKWSVLLSNVFGMASSVLDMPFQYSKYYHQTGDAYAALGQVGKDWLQDAMDANPMLNHLLWENQVRSSVRPPIVESVSRQLEMMKLTAGSRQAERYEGTTGGRNPLPVPMSGGADDKRIPTDPTMRQMYFDTANEYQFIQSNVMGDIQNLRKQMAAVQDHVGDITEKREFHNAGARLIADKYAYIQARIEDLNAALSKQVGRHVDVAHINWKQGPDQFSE